LRVRTANSDGNGADLKLWRENKRAGIWPEMYVQSKEPARTNLDDSGHWRNPTRRQN